MHMDFSFISPSATRADGSGESKRMPSREVDSGAADKIDVLRTFGEEVTLGAIGFVAVDFESQHNARRSKLGVDEQKPPTGIGSKEMPQSPPVDITLQPPDLPEANLTSSKQAGDGTEFIQLVAKHMLSNGSLGHGTLLHNGAVSPVRPNVFDLSGVAKPSPVIDGFSVRGAAEGPQTLDLPLTELMPSTLHRNMSGGETAKQAALSSSKLSTALDVSVRTHEPSAEPTLQSSAEVLFPKGATVPGSLRAAQNERIPSVSALGSELGPIVQMPSDAHGPSVAKVAEQARALMQKDHGVRSQPPKQSIVEDFVGVPVPLLPNKKSVPSPTTLPLDLANDTILDASRPGLQQTRATEVGQHLLTVTDVPAAPSDPGPTLQQPLSGQPMVTAAEPAKTYSNAPPPERLVFDFERPAPSNASWQVALVPAAMAQVSLQTSVGRGQPTFVGAEEVSPLAIEGERQTDTILQSTVSSRNAAPPSTASPISTQIRDAIGLSGATSRSVEIALKPEELGNLRMTLTPSESGGIISILVERPETLELVQRHLEALRRELRDAGWAHSEVSVSQENDAQTDPDTDEGSSFEGQDGQRIVSQTVQDTRSDPTVPHLQLRVISGLDLRI